MNCYASVKDRAYQEELGLVGHVVPRKNELVLQIGSGTRGPNNFRALERRRKDYSGLGYGQLLGGSCVTYTVQHGAERTICCSIGKAKRSTHGHLMVCGNATIKPDVVPVMGRMSLLLASLSP